MMSAMSPAQESGTGGNDDATPSVLANLPRTRPQRATARRTAARNANGGPPAGSGTAKPAARRKQSAPRAAKASAASPTAAKSTASSTTAKPKRSSAASKRARPAAAKPRRQPPRGARAPHAASEPPVPRQGFESDGANASGPVPPPGGAELLATAAEIVSEVARASVSTGERLLRDAFSRLRR